MRIRPPRFDPTLEQEYLESRASDHWALLRWAVIVVAPLYVVVGVWDEMLDPGSLRSTWPIRVGLTAFFLIFAAVIWRARSVRVLGVAWLVAFAASAIGFVLIIREIDGGYLAGVAALVIPMVLVGLSLTHLQAMGGLAALVALPIIMYAAFEATAVEITNLSVWLFTGAAFAYIAFRAADTTRRRVFLAERDLAAERDRSETLLLNVLPKTIADQLKEDSATIAERFEMISILFADIVGFTPISQAMSAEEAVDMLSGFFSHFDELVDRLGVEKIRTIGDSYMAVAGVPTPMYNHAAVLAALAVEIRDYVRASPPFNGHRIDFRIGISSGPAVAGVIGTKKFQYDVWGDAVNTASRMESHGVPGRIQITEATRDLIQDEYECIPRGEIDIKGKGRMKTWFLEGRLESP